MESPPSAGIFKAFTAPLRDGRVHAEMGLGGGVKRAGSFLQATLIGP